MNETRSGNRMCERALRELDSHFGEEPLSAIPEVLEHFRQCPACSKELEDRTLMRDRLRTAARSVSAPPRLQAKIRSSIRESGHKTAWGRYFLPVAATLLVSLGGVVAYELGHLRLTTGSQESYIGSISGRVANVMKVGLGDHVHCTVFRKFPRNPPTLEEMAGKLGPEYAGLLPLVKDRVPADFQIVMAHQCGYHGRKFVHLALRSDSKLLSLVISLKRDGESFTKENLLPVLSESGIPMYHSGVQRFEIAGFESDKHLVFVVSDLPGPKNIEILTALAPAVKDLLNKVKV
jgi:hypothetical protein